LLISCFAQAQTGLEGYVGEETEYEPQTSAAKGYRPGASVWEYCATENERCRADGWGVVRYGRDGRYVYREFRNARFWCDNRTFGDPVPRRKKSCELRFYGGNPPPIGGGYDDGYGDNGYEDSDGWERCASEGDSCRLPGPAVVRYGASGRYVTRNVNGGIVRCDNRSFGDPAPGKGKHCDYRLERYSGRPGYDQGRPEYAGGGWERCAREGDYCEFRGRRQVRYGADGRFVFEEFRGGTECTNAAFGTDPAPRKRKYCEVEVR
jgi:hypothetical protein